MADKRDYYEVLGIAKTASDDEIKGAYRKLAKKYHPDLHPGDKASEEKFKEVGEAYEILSNKEKRQRYDQFGHAGVDPNYGAGAGGGFGGFGGGGVDLGDLFGDLFGGGGFGGFGGGGRRQADPNAPRRGGDVRMSLRLTFMEAVHGCKKTINVKTQKTCTECGGTGAAKGTSPETCSDCHGSGYVTVQQRTPFGVMQQTRPCPKCGGKGKIIKTPCSKCHGSGNTVATTPVEITIPAGINDDQSMRVGGKGDAGLNGGPNGDLIVTVSVAPDAMFEREDNDIHVTVPITYGQAALGAKITVPTIDGNVECDVAEGTKSVSTMRLRGKGVQYVNGYGRGDQYIHTVVEIPKKLTRTQRDALKAFEDTLKDDNYEKRKSFFKSLKDKFDKK